MRRTFGLTGSDRAYGEDHGGDDLRQFVRERRDARPMRLFRRCADLRREPADEACTIPERGRSCAIAWYCSTKSLPYDLVKHRRRVHQTSRQKRGY